MITVNNLRKEFKKLNKEPGVKGSIKVLFKPNYEIIKAVNGIDFYIPKGEMLGFIGPNGAGKSTVIKMLTGILTPTSGTCEINGYIPHKNRQNYVREIGVVFGQRSQLWWDLALSETYSILKEIYDVPDKEYKKRMEFLNEVLDINNFISNPVRTLSLGQRMRADIAASLLHNPKVLFLDEPTIGLDVVAKDNIRNAIRKINAEERTTIVLTTHDLTDVENLCEHIVMIDKGEKIFDGRMNTLKQRFGQMRVLQFKLLNTEEQKKLNYTMDLNIPKDCVDIEYDKAVVSVKFNINMVSVEDIISYTLSRVHVKDIVLKESNLEEIIRRVYRQEVNIDGV